MPRGRPRQYPNNAARHRAFRERRRETMAQRDAKAQAESTQLHQLLGEYDRLLRHNTALAKQHAQAKETNASLRRELKQALLERAEAFRQRDTAIRSLKNWQDPSVRRMLGLDDPAHERADELRQEIRKRFHPDKWSQGQLAMELAHELMVYVNR